jgi:hypothetical protein
VHNNYEITLLQLQYFCNSYPNFMLTPIYKLLIKLNFFEAQSWNSWLFLKDTLQNLYNIYEWKNPEIFENIKENKNMFINFGNYLGKAITHYYNDIYNYKCQFQDWNDTLKSFNCETKKYIEIKDITNKIAQLFLDEKYKDAPINYPNHSQIELYDTFSEILGLETKTLIAEKVGTSNAKETISKIEVKYENDKKELQLLIKTIISYFNTIFNLQIPDLELKEKIKDLTQLLRNKLWYFHNQKGDSYGNNFKILGDISDILKRIIENVKPITVDKPILFEDVISQIELYFEDVKNKIIKLQTIEHKKTLDKLLKQTLNLKPFQFLDITLNLDNLLINQNQLQFLKHKISEICEYLKPDIIIPDVMFVLKDVINIEFNFQTKVVKPAIIQEYKEEPIIEITEPTISDLTIQITQLKIQISELTKRIQNLEK